MERIHHYDQKRGRGDGEGGSRTVRHRLEFLPKPTKDHGIGHPFRFPEGLCSLLLAILILVNACDDKKKKPSRKPHAQGNWVVESASSY